MMDVFQLLCRKMIEVLPRLEQVEIKPTDSMRNLCANSIDRMDVLISTLEALDLNVPLTQLHGPKNLQELTDLLSEKVSQQTENV